MTSKSLTTHEPRHDRWDTLLLSLIAVVLILTSVTSLQGIALDPLLSILLNHDWMKAALRPSLLWVSMGLLMLSFRTVLWFRYKPFLAATLENAPHLTVIIPAYNEGAMVEKTIDSVLAADYPRDRLQVIVVDDGSQDATWDYIQKAARRYPRSVTCLQFANNRGKREALAAGFRRAQGEVVLTIDSDSLIEPQTLLAMVGPFANKQVGAVAGKVLVYNRREGLIPRMLHVRFMLSFDFLRAAQSTYGTVYCTPGALSAYRNAVVKIVLQEWLQQNFMGVRATYGEDRALTNYILDQGYDSVYQRTGIVHTIMPITYSKLCKMYLRWDRSYIREELRFFRIVWKRPFKSMLIALIDSVITNLRYPVSYGAMLLLILVTINDPLALLRTLIAIGVVSSFYMLYYLRSERSWDVVFGILYSYFAFFGLWWIFPYAAFTLRSRSWMTR
ncbi:MAG: glycosyltransferase family 2 protein [Gammaproteobacteria bacterium]|nr:glycosyltransferase family 2 protein [Gammaproteobacteria bacterium]